MDENTYTITKFLIRFLKEYNVFTTNLISTNHNPFKYNITTIQELQNLIEKYKIKSLHDVQTLLPKILKQNIIFENYQIIQLKYTKFITQQIKTIHKENTKNIIIKQLQKNNITINEFINDAKTTIYEQNCQYYHSWRSNLKYVYNNINTIEDIVNNIPPTLIMWYTVLAIHYPIKNNIYENIHNKLKKIFNEEKFLNLIN